MNEVMNRGGVIGFRFAQPDPTAHSPQEEKYTLKEGDLSDLYLLSSLLFMMF
jgi:hypothetical protein